MKYLRLLFDNMWRNPLRTVLTSMGTMVLVCVVTLIFTILTLLDAATAEKSQNLKAIVTEKWQIPSQMPYSYAGTLAKGAPREPGDIEVPEKDSMVWSFFGGSLNAKPSEGSNDDKLFAFCLKPRNLYEMMDDLDSLKEPLKSEFRAIVDRLEANRQGIILGKDRLEKLKKKVGDRIRLYSMNYREIQLEVEILGLFPPGRYNSSSVLHIDYLRAAMDQYEKEKGKRHPLADKSLNLVWLRLPDRKTFEQVSAQIDRFAESANPSVKIETASSGVSTFLEAYRDLFWGIRWILTPSILITLSLIISNAISISVRERRTEFAVLKVLGFLPSQILWLVLGEALFIGIVSGLMVELFLFGLVNWWMGGFKFPIAFFSDFLIPWEAWWWGPVMGGGTALLGCFLPAWNARSVKVSEVFSRVG